MSPELSGTLQTLLVWVAPSLAVIAVGFVITASSNAYAAWKRNQPDKAYVLEQAVAMAVQAAEQNGLVAKVKQLAFDKKEYALAAAQSYLKTQGVGIDLKTVDAAVEAKVFELFNKPPDNGDFKPLKKIVG